MGYKILVSILAAEDRFIDAPVGVPVHFVKNSRKCQRLGSGLSASNVDPVPSSQRHAILSIVETCRSLKIPVRDYLAAVLPGTGHVGSCGPVVVFTAIPEKSDLCPSRPQGHSEDRAKIRRRRRGFSSIRPSVRMGAKIKWSIPGSLDARGPAT
jgi:hypothetical protein